MNFLRSIVNWIASLEAGSQFRKWVSILLKIISILALVGAIVWGIAIFVDAITESDHLETGKRTVVIIGSILGLCVNVIVGTILLMLFWNRSKKIGALGDETHFALLPIAVILIRLFGEVGFLTLVGTGIQGLVSSIFGSGIVGILDFFMSDQLMYENINFIIGVLSLVISVITGVLTLIIHYFIAELINLFVDMATNLRKIETTLSTENTPSDSTEDTPSDS